MDFNAMKLPELKAEAKSRKIKGFSTMKKSELITALEANNKITSGLDNSNKGNVKDLGDFTQYVKAESFIDGVKATFANMREARSNKGRSAGQHSKQTAKMMPDAKAENYRLQNGSMSAKLTGKQSRRVRKAERAQGRFSGGADSTKFTYV